MAVDPAAKFRSADNYLRMTRAGMHMHIVITAHQRVRVADLQLFLLRLWSKVTSSQHLGEIGEIKSTRFMVESEQHETNTLAYLARHIKPVWNHRQALAAYDLVHELPRSAMSRLLGAAGTIRKLRSRDPLIGDALQFNRDLLSFDPVFLTDWK